jgi:hypothetical protein
MRYSGCLLEVVAPLMRYRGCLLEVVAPLMRYRGCLLEVVAPLMRYRGCLLEVVACYYHEILRLSFGGCCFSHEYRSCLLKVVAPLMRCRGCLLEVVAPLTRYRGGLFSWKVVNNLWLCYHPISCYCLLFSFACHFFEKSRKTCRG